MPPKNTPVTAAMYKSWRDSSPVTPFPFEYKDRKEGKIKQTWKDVKDKLNRDAQNYNLAFATSHIAPALCQANVLQEVAKKDGQLAATILRQNETRMDVHDPSDPYYQLADRQRTATGSSRAIEGLAHAATTPKKFLSEAEEDTLRHNTGGRARQQYLQMRNKLPTQVRYGSTRTSSQAYGWALLNHEDRDSLTDQSREQQIEAAEVSRRAAVAGSTATWSLEAGGGRSPTKGAGSPAKSTAAGSLPALSPMGSKAPLSASSAQRRMPISEFLAPDLVRAQAAPPTCPPPVSTVAPYASVLMIPLKSNEAPKADADAHGGPLTSGGASARLEAHPHARGDFRKRAFTTGLSRGSGVFPRDEFVM